MNHLSNITGILRYSFAQLRAHPSLLAALLLLWVAYVPLVAYLAFHADVTGTPPIIASLLLFMVPILLHFGIAQSCAALIYMQQERRKEKPASVFSCYAKAFAEHKYALALFGVTAGALNMIIIMIQAVHSPDVGGIPDELRQHGLENLARILLATGSENILMVEAMKYALIKKAIRLTVFLSVAALVWERHTALPGFERALFTIDKNMFEAIGGLMMTTVIVYILSIPAAYVVTAHDSGVFTLTDAGWYGLIAYSGLLWSAMLYFEQHYCLTLFRWQQAREAKGAKAQLGDAPMPQWHQG